MDHISQKDVAKNMKKFTTTPSSSAFTMLELVFVIVALGIIAAVAIPRIDRDLTQEAADTVLSNIRYTQHLALVDYRHDFTDPKWQRAFWQIRFESCADSSGLFLSIGSDKGYGGDIDKSEAATDPANGLPMFWKNTDACTHGGDATVSENIFLTKKFGVKSVTGTGGCAGISHIGFDHMGRPHTGFKNSSAPNYSTYMRQACTFTFTMSSGETFAVTIQPESGYVTINTQSGS